MTSTQPLQAIGLAPLLTVANVTDSVRFYEGLGFEIEERHQQNGTLLGAMLRAGEARLNLVQDDWSKGRDRQKGIGFRVFIVTRQSIDDLAARAKAAGVPIDGEAQNMPWGRSFSTTDPDGFKVTISNEPRNR